jgi:hypothetical protein
MKRISYVASVIAEEISDSKISYNSNVFIDFNIYPFKAGPLSVPTVGYQQIMKF